MAATVVQSDTLSWLKTQPDQSFDSVVTDPPYGLGNPNIGQADIEKFLQTGVLKPGEFKGKDWEFPTLQVWRELNRVLKPGGYLVSFGGTRMADLISIGIRCGGFEKRDEIGCNLPTMRWVRGKGMPKSRKVGEGFGTGLRPLWEPIMLFRKPFKGTLDKNWSCFGTGGINIEGCRVPHAGAKDFDSHKKMVDGIKARGGKMEGSWKNSSDLSGASDVTAAGRWPTNSVYCHSNDCVRMGTARIKGSVSSTKEHDAYEGESSTGFLRGRSTPGVNQHGEADGLETVESWSCSEDCPVRALDEGRPNQPSRVFSRFEADPFMYCFAYKSDYTLNGRLENDHPTRKPLALMRWLIRLVTPPKGRVLDPYCGSGTTLHAAMLEGVDVVGVDRWDLAIRVSQERVRLVQADLSLPEPSDELADLFASIDTEETDALHEGK